MSLEFLLTKPEVAGTKEYLPGGRVVSAVPTEKMPRDGFTLSGPK